MAGSDSGGGAGIQADLRTLGALGHHGACAVTCITAQNTRGVQLVEAVSPELLEAQVTSVMADFEVSAAKTGVLPTPELVEAAARLLGGAVLVVDPVMAAEAGGSLADFEALEATAELLVPAADVVTPNTAEAEVLTGVAVNSSDSAEEAAQALLDMGAGAAVVTGGHLGEAVDTVATGEGVERLVGERIPGRFHGTGCTFSAALAASMADGNDVFEAASVAKEFTAAAIRGAHRAGSGPRPVEPLSWLRERRS